MKPDTIYHQLTITWLKEQKAKYESRVYGYQKMVDSVAKQIEQKEDELEINNQSFQDFAYWQMIYGGMITCCVVLSLLLFVLFGYWTLAC